MPSPKKQTPDVAVGGWCFAMHSQPGFVTTQPDVGNDPTVLSPCGRSKTLFDGRPIVGPPGGSEQSGCMGHYVGPIPSGKVRCRLATLPCISLAWQ